MATPASRSTENAPPRVLFLSSEVTPFAKTGGLADVSSSLPVALARSGVEITIVMPLYRQVRSSGIALEPVETLLEVPIGPKMLNTRVFSSELSSGVRVYFIERDEFFDRSGLYGTSSGDYFDNDGRFIFFSRASLTLARSLDYRPDVIHCNDWQTGLVPVYVKSPDRRDSFFANTGLLFTIHNLAYQGLFPAETMAVTGLPRELFSMEGLEFHRQINFMKGGIVFSDRINTVSPKYAKEIQTSEYGCGLEGVLRQRADVLTGILNGIDDTCWNPEKDPFIVTPFSPADPSGKRACKKDLMELFGLVGPETRPLIGMVTRLAGQKGLDIVMEAMDRLCDLDMFLVIQGRGEHIYEQMLKEIGEKHRGRVGIHIAFDEAVAHKIEAGSDMFLMPSLYEPCGLNQMYSLKYGTIPIVRAVGGLDDTVQEFDPKSKQGTGFKFLTYSSTALVKAVRRALTVFGSPPIWARLMTNAFASDFSWSKAAGQYRTLYEQTRSTARAPRKASPRSSR